MVSEDMPDGGPRRLHPTTLGFSIGRSLKNLLIPAVLALFSGRGSVWEWIFLVSFGVATVLAIFRYVTLTWALDPEEIVVKQGVVFRSERHVPYARIQNVDLVQNVFHRLFGVAEVRLETAGGKEPEAVLRVVSLDDVERIRARVLERPAQDQDERGGAEQDDGRVILRVPAAHLVFLGLLVNRGFALVAVGFGLLHELNAFERVGRSLGLEQRVNELAQSGLRTAVFQILVLVAAIALVFVAFSIAWSLVRFYGFTLRAVGADLRLSCGLFTRIAASLPRYRIQAVTVREPWVQRLFGFASIAVQTAGGTAGEETATLLRRRFVPILRADDIPRVLGAVLPDYDGAELAWQPISRTAARRMRRRALIAITVLALPATWFWPYAPIPAVLLAALAFWHAGAAARRARYARTGWGLVWQRGVLTRRTTLLPDEKIQTVQVVASPFDRRNEHATLRTDAAGGGPAGPEVQIRYLDTTEAERLRRELALAASATQYVVAGARR